jgi:hypothetical protein
MERMITMKLMGALMVMVAVGACNSGSVTGPSVVAPGPGPAATPGPDTTNGADIQGSGIPATESRDVPGVSRVTLRGVGHLIVEPGAAPALTVSADDNILPLVTAEVYGDELVLGTSSDQTFASVNPIVFHVTVTDLEALAVLGAAGAEVRDLDAERFTIRIDGAAAVTTAGRVDEQEIVLNGVARYDGRHLDSRAARVHVAGVSEAVVRVRERLEGHVEGQSSLEYIGQPEVSVTGGGAVQPADD